MLASDELAASCARGPHGRNPDSEFRIDGSAALLAPGQCDFVDSGHDDSPGYGIYVASAFVVDGDGNRAQTVSGMLPPGQRGGYLHPLKL